MIPGREPWSDGTGSLPRSSHSQARRPSRGPPGPPEETGSRASARRACVPGSADRDGLPSGWAPMGPVRVGRTVSHGGRAGVSRRRDVFPLRKDGPCRGYGPKWSPAHDALADDARGRERTVCPSRACDVDGEDSSPTSWGPVSRFLTPLYVKTVVHAAKSAAWRAR